jgi:RimJ/RimL family protein N-acetyltransferase
VNVVARIRWEFGGLMFVLRNVWYTRRMQPIPEVRFDDLAIRGLRRSEVDQFDALHQALRDGRPLGLWRRTAYRWRGSRLIPVAVDGDRVVAFELFYFREHEAARHVIHEAFVGVLPEYRGGGLSARMRKHTCAFFSTQGLRSVSAQVSVANVASRKAALASGYQVTDERTASDGCTWQTIVVDLTSLASETNDSS